MSQTPAGCRLEPVEDAVCRAWLDHVVQNGTAPDNAIDLRWLLAHCDDGVVWGRKTDGDWRLSSEPFPDVSPRLGVENVQQLRLFGPECELLMWRIDDGFRGRLLTHGPNTADPSFAPEEQDNILVGDRVLRPARDGFTVVGDGRGSRHAVPLACQEAEFSAHSLRLKVWHYFAADGQSGFVRIVASRLADVRKVTKENS